MGSSVLMRFGLPSASEPRFLCELVAAATCKNPHPQIRRVLHLLKPLVWPGLAMSRLAQSVLPRLAAHACTPTMPHRMALMHHVVRMANHTQSNRLTPLQPCNQLQPLWPLSASFLPKGISAHSLWATGAMALLCARAG
jgi:hypothetical protein